MSLLNRGLTAGGQYLLVPILVPDSSIQGNEDSSVLFSRYLWALQLKLRLVAATTVVLIKAATLNKIFSAATVGEPSTAPILLSFIEVLTNYKRYVSHMTDFYIKKGDTLPRIESTLKYSNDAAVDLTGATQVELVYRFMQDDTIFTKTGTIVNEAQGKVAYQWVAGDTAVPGEYQAEWRITYSGGGVLTIPNDGSFIELKIVPTLS